MLAKKYQSAKIRLFFIELAVTIIYFLVFQFSGISRLTKSYVLRFFENQALIIIGYLFIFGAIYYLINFPIKFYSGFLLEHKYALSNQKFSGWLKDEAKATLISSAIFLMFVELFYYLLKISQGLWWLWMALIWFFFSIFFARIFPVLILPLFYKYKDIDNLNLKQALIDLAKRSGIEVLDVFQIDLSRKTKKANAGLIGLGKTKRIVLADNLTADYNEAQIKTVLAHELGHYKLGHMWKLLIFGAIISLVNFYIVFLSANYIIRILGIPHIYDIETFPAISLILALFSFATLPLCNGYSRKLEREADAFSLANTKDKGAFISCMQRLAQQNLSDPSPNRFIEILFYDHPPISKRIKFAQGEFVGD